MDHWFLLLCLFLRCFAGVPSVETVFETVFVRKGDSVVLHAGVKELMSYEMLQWKFGSTIIAELPSFESVIFHNNGFGKGLGLDLKTGSLSILSVNTDYSGIYTLDIVILKLRDELIFETALNKGFNITVSDPLTTPIITKNSSNCSSSSSSSSSSLERSSSPKCVLLCSVMNVSHVTLSWYKGNSLHSTASLSDPITTPRPLSEDEYRRKRSYEVMANPKRVNTSLSLPLEVEYHDTNTYSCVVSNSSSNLTQHLDIKESCGRCSEPTTASLYLLALIPVALGLFLGGIYLCWKYGKGRQEGICCKTSHGVLKWCSVNSPLMNCSE